MSDLPEDFDCTVTDWEYIYASVGASQSSKDAQFDLR
jgi:hypothetical protein